MKKFLSVCICICMIFGFYDVLADTSVKGKRINAKIYREDDTIFVSGSLVYPAEKRVSLILKDSFGAIIYLNQTKSTPDGNFLFEFTPQTPISEDETYTAIVGCGGTQYSEKLEIKYSDIKNVFENIRDPYTETAQTYYKQKAIELDMNVSISRYVPTITGSVVAHPGSYAQLYVEDELNNNQKIAEYQTDRKGMCTFSYTFPSLQQTQKYKCKLQGSGGLDIEFGLDVKSIIAKISYDIKMNDDAYAELDFNISDEREPWKLYNDSNGTFPFPYLSRNANYQLKATFYDTFTEDDIHSVSKFQNESLYNALIKKYPNLDEENSGVICSSDITGTNGVLDLSNCGLKNIIGLQDAKIDKIILDNNQITSIRPLIFIDSLTYVTAKNNRIYKLSDFGSNITYMNLDKNDLHSLYGLRKALNTTYLSANNSHLRYIDALGLNKNLKYISVENNSLIDVYHLKGCKGLSTLNISENSISDISDLSKLELNFLSAANNDISCIDGIGDNKNLKYLNLKNNDLSDISQLNGCSSLVHLNLSGNNITNLSVLNELKQLYYVDLTDNPVND